MKKTTIVLISLLAVGCNPVTQVPFQTSNTILRGTWSGEAAITPMLRSLSLDPKRNHLIESITTGLYIRDAATGEVLRHVRTAPWMGEVHPRADDRLVAVNGKKIYILSPETLQVEKTLNLSGLLTLDASHVLVRKGMEIQRVSTTTGLLAGRDPEGLSHTFTEDGQYAFKGHTLIHFETGQVIKDILPDPEAARSCGETSNLPILASLNEQEHTLTVGFEHREVQVFDTRTWQKTFSGKPLDCSNSTLTLDLQGDELHYLSNAELGLINIKTGSQTRREVTPEPHAQALYHNSTWWRIRAGHLDSHTLEGLKWQDVRIEPWFPAPQKATFELKATYQDIHQYGFEGTLSINGETYLVRNGTVTGDLVEFKQARPASMDVHAELFTQQEEWVGSLDGMSGIRADGNLPDPQYSLSLLLGGTVHQVTIKPVKVN